MVKSFTRQKPGFTKKSFCSKQGNDEQSRIVIGSHRKIVEKNQAATLII